MRTQISVVDANELDAILSLIAMQVFSSLDTLGVLCLRLAEGQDVVSEVSRRHSQWKCSLAAVVDILEKYEIQPAAADVAGLGTALDEIRDFYIIVYNISKGVASDSRIDGARFIGAHRVIIQAIIRIGDAVGIKPSYLARFIGMRESLYNRSLELFVSQAGLADQKS